MMAPVRRPHEPGSPRSRPRRRRPVVWWLAAAGLIAALGALGLWLRRTSHDTGASAAAYREALGERLPAWVAALASRDDGDPYEGERREQAAHEALLEQVADRRLRGQLEELRRLAQGGPARQARALGELGGELNAR